MNKLTSYTIVRAYPFPPSRVFAAVTTPKLAAQWMWGARAKNCVASIEARVGGLFHVSCDAQGPIEEPWGATWAATGYVFAFEPNERFAFVQRWLANVGYNAAGMNPLDEVVEIRFRATPEGCEISYLHAGIPDDGVSAVEHEKAVRSTLDDLEKVIATAAVAEEDA